MPRSPVTVSVRLFVGVSQLMFSTPSTPFAKRTVPVNRSFVLGVDAPLGLGVDPHRLGADHEAHDVEVVRSRRR